ncbi:hypothetical protein WQ57_17405 [Mesobacillus campisalis]|uniref:Uncharacterized protein n=1 Tax=Mesobacillus campisalis TaxID=1408103 RepID=A0A0M2SW34_9BACI|nr:hypothetical protein WQ57_22290 [Mesobacillus campisalis]KKK36364.1 hypothetical protein WQ57_19460 [Mesobacillus campisalis]KKK36835.1 hypothetical protein WQ57_17405 [Mesobacillus campisalis]
MVFSLRGQRMWLPILASAGIGAAAYYSMTRGKNVGQAMQAVLPIVSNLTGKGSRGQQYS